MKRYLTLLLFTTLLASSCSIFKKNSEPAPAAYTARAGADRNQTYTDKFQTAAILEMQRLGVPASITLAQGILESGAGTSELAQNANNHFGIKCGNNWTGDKYMKKDDDRDANGDIKESCFRKYKKVEDSYMDHGQFLRDPKKETRYGFLFKLDPTDYKGWAQGLQAAGYSTSNTYADKLIDIIERYKLYEYDIPGKNTNVLPNPEKPQYGTETDADIALPTAENRVGRVNNVKVVVAREGETINDIAKAFRLSPAKLVGYNDHGYTPIQKLKANTRIFLDQKKDKASASEHIVKGNQTMHEISQIYGVKLNKILERNGMSRGQEPAEGTRIRLNSKRAANDPVQLRDASDAGDASTDKPNEYWPTTPPSETMTPDEGGLLDEISGGEANKNQPVPAPTTPATPDKPATGAPAPVVTGAGYPPVITNPNPTPNPNPTTPPVAAPGTHIVVKGDTLTNIARRYNTTVARLKQINNLKSDYIQIGQTLRVQ
ncbi:MAG: LysM peptidoglycan-binding domain-containing protein [Haliscomenobacteraceae bacterium CHB4]|nr:hypothetical protein [Saprospiraceae bacterium]MCE7925101.1 LysM peptidoglycan-binding domain-containing protein [Haliscomenobacteraceae bacterium CHB4]